MYYVYILQSKKDGELYTGCTNDLRKRIKMHNSGEISSAKLRKPFELVYYEAYQNKKDAFQREMFFKTGWGRNYIRRALKYYFKSQSKNLGG